MVVEHHHGTAYRKLSINHNQIAMENTTEGNQLIAEFMGGKIIPHNSKLTPNLYEFPESIGNTNTHEWPSEYLIYHKSWDWLMPVVQKAANIPEDGYIFARSLDGGLFMDIQSVYNAVVEFINFYNAKQIKL